MEYKFMLWLVAAFILFVIADNFDGQGVASNAFKKNNSITRGHMPAITVDKKGTVHLIYGNSDSLMYTYSSDKGETFSQPKLIATINGLFSTATRGPRLAITADGLAVIATTQSGSVFSVTKSGNKWNTPGKITDADSVNLEGFADVSSDGHSNLFAAWLDLRGNRRNKIYGAWSADGGKTWSKNMEVYTSPDTSVCECCRISVAMQGQKVYIMFRNWLNGNRDMYIVNSTDAGKSFDAPHKLGTGSWALKGCPMDGGGLSINNGIAQTVWRRENTIYTCADGGIELPIGQGRSCTIANANGTNAYAWVEKGNVVCKVSSGNLQAVGQGSSPAITAIDNNTLICVWENKDEIQKRLLNY